jgi:large subunit ribosomal protein L5
MSEMANPMTQLRVTKVCVNIGVGEGGDRLVNAENVLEMVTGVRPQRTLGRIQNRDLKVRLGAPIGCKVTIRNQAKIMEFLKDAFNCRENTIPSWNFDREGNLSFGVRDYTDFPGQKYDPEIGIYGMDITAVLERPGHRVNRRRRAKAKVGKAHKVTTDESRTWFAQTFGLNILEE